MLQKKLKKIKNENLWLRLIWFKLLKRKGQQTKTISDIERIGKLYKKAFGKEIDLNNPKFFYEKLNWLKLNYRNDLMPILADKFLVRKYLLDKGYGHLLNNLLGVWDSVANFNETTLPRKFVLKATHASGTAWSEVIKEKEKIKWSPLKKIMGEWIRQDIAWMGREWHYSKMTPRIIAEEYLEDESGELRDYKFHCFNGEPKFVNVCIGRFTKHKKFLCFDRNWNLLNFTHDYKTLPPNFNLERPINLDKMFKLASELSLNFPYLRVDFYNVNGKIYFGEFTFFDFSAFRGPYTEEAQNIIGDWLILPVNYNEKN